MLPRAERGDEFAATLLKWRGITKQLSTYVVSLLEKQNPVLGGPRPRLFTTYKLHGTVTGRLSSENPNIQNIPRDRKSTRLNSSHVRISYAVFCLKKKKNKTNQKQNT